MKVNEKLSILVLPKSARKSKDGALSLDIRITVNLKRAVISLGQKIPDHLWDQEAGKATGNSQEARLVNNAIEKSKVRLRQIYSTLELQEENVTVEMLKEAYQGKTEDPKTLLDALDFVIERFEKKVEKQYRAVASLKKLRTIRSKTVNFLQHQYKAKDIRLDKIKFAFAEDFIDYLMLEEDINANTAKKYLKHVKHAIKAGVERTWIPVNPIQSFKCGYIDPERDILDEREIMTLYRKHFEIKRLEEIKDVYLFMCFTGFAYKDTSLLTVSHIVNFFDGQEWIVKNREKTYCRENVPLLPIAKEIIEKYRDHPVRKSKGLLLPVLTNQKYNAYLKEVVDICGINKTLTTHTARHTFATTITLANGVPIETVSALLGHKSIKTTQIYAKIVARKIGDDMNELKKKLMIKMPALINQASVISIG
ncbi:MAG: site-specific integrase [Mucilaginibacter sp.]|nr:site-specific integrase [Mucilaginibacter sp.]